ASAERSRILLEVNNAIISNLTRAALFHKVCEALARAISFDRVALALYDQDTDLIRLVAFEGRFVSQHFTVGQTFEPKDSHFGQAILHQRALVRGDLRVEAQFDSERRAAEEGIRSICTVPLLVRGRGIGAVNLASRTPNQYSEADAEFFREVANQVALAVG